MSDMIENITFMHCPEDRRVKVRVPVLVSFLLPSLSPAVAQTAGIAM